jgi:hypothetical protein
MDEMTSEQSKDGNFTVNQAFFEEAIERYKKAKEERDSLSSGHAKYQTSSDRKIRPKKEFHDEIKALVHSSDRETKIRKKTSAAEVAAVSKNTVQNESSGDFEKKRLASRVSSRRTRERERLRLDHFRNVKLQLAMENKKLREDNLQLRDLIKKTKKEQAVLNLKTYGVQSMFANQSGTSTPLTSIPSCLGNPGLAAPQAVLEQPNLFLDPTTVAPAARGTSPVQTVQLQQQSQQQLLLAALYPLLLAANVGVPSLLSNPIVLSMVMADPNNFNASLLAAAVGQANLATTGNKASLV